MSYRIEEREIKRTDKVIVGANCDECHAELQPVTGTDPNGSWLGAGAAGALTLRIEGGYAEFYDGPPACIMLCRNCAALLANHFVAVKKAISRERT